MAITNKNVPLLHRKEWQMMTPAPAAAVAGGCVIAPDSGNWNNALFVASASVQYLYNHDEDAWLQIPSAALAGTFGAGTCGVFHPWSINYTANGGTTSSVTVAAATHNITGRSVGSSIEILSGPNTGQRRTITSILNNAGQGTVTLNFEPALPVAVAATNTFALLTGRFFVLNAGTLAAGAFRVLDVATMAWVTLAHTGLPATWGTDGKLVTPYNYGEVFGSGTTDSATSTTLVDADKTWTVNQWTNFEVRITAGTGVGQRRTILSNTATTLTVAAWTTTPDATSTFDIRANSDWLYLLGNNAVTMYRYSISANTWTTMAPTTARSGAPAIGMSANAVGVTGDPVWANESAILDGRYIYSLRGGGSAFLDRFDIAGGTAGAGAWLQVATINAETFTTGSSAFPMGEFLYIRQNATNRFFKYSVVDNAIRPFSTNLYPDSTAVLGSKIWVKNLDPSGTIRWLYSLRNNGIELHRIMVF